MSGMLKTGVVVGSKGKGERGRRKHGDGGGSACSQLPPLLIKTRQEGKVLTACRRKEGGRREEFFQR